MLHKFPFKGREVNVVQIDGQPWWKAADVCRCIGLGVGIVEGSANRHLGRLAPDERRLIRKSQLTGTRGADWPNAGATCINESGLYKLIMRSDKPEAREFQDWVTREVLPAIRRTGGYLLNEHARETAHADERTQIPLPAEFLAVFQKQAEQIDRLLGIVERLTTQPAVNQPPVEEEPDGFTKDYYTAREVVLKLRLAGATPTAREVQAMTVKVGQALSHLSRQMDAPFKTKKRGEFDVRLYPREVCDAYALRAI